MAGFLDSGLAAIGTALGGADALTAGNVNAWLMAGNPIGEAVGRAGLRFAAMGGELTKGVFIFYENGKWVPFSFPMNPSEMTEKVSPEYSVTKVPGQNYVWYTFNNGGERELTFTLVFWYAHIRRGTVADQIATLRRLCRRQDTGDTVAANAAPSPVYFYYGKYINGAQNDNRFIVKSLNVKAFDLFDPAFLLPLRAEVEITLAEARTLKKDRENVISRGDQTGSLSRILRAGF